MSAVLSADPCLAFVNGWNEAMAEVEAIAKVHETDEAPNKHWFAKVVPFFDQAKRSEVPAATTAEGAAAALQRVLDWDDSEDADTGLIRSALAFLRGPVVVMQPDPLVNAIAVYNAENEAEDAMSLEEFQAHVDANGLSGAGWTGLQHPPVATSLAGVFAALRLVVSEDKRGRNWHRSKEDEQGFLERAVLPFLDAPSSPSPTDPFLERMDRYRSDVAAFNASRGDEDGAEPGRAFSRELQNGAVPIMTSAGALDAIRHVLGDDCISDTLDIALVEAVAAFLEGRTV